ncbi:MAG: hypothetical protein GXP61_05135 [Epsilonproteobacteria bacterium]|nr:hypothetical protein [Campylobacterota bacterium]
MNLDLKDEPRIFGVKGHEVKDFGKIYLDSDEMVSFKTKSNKEYDFTAKEWGFYASPSVNSRLKNEGFKTALVVNENNQIYIMVVEKDKIKEFKRYLKENQDNRIICWLDEFFMEEV